MEKSLNNNVKATLKITEMDFPIVTIVDETDIDRAPKITQVRFLDAIDNHRSFNIRIDDDIYIANLGFGDASNYEAVTEGLHRLVVTRAAWPEEKPLFDQELWVDGGYLVTMVLTESPEGVDLSPMNDLGCPNLSSNLGCFRVANMSYPNSEFDIYYEDEAIFRNLKFKRSSWYKETIVGEYQFHVMPASIIGLKEELPILVTRNVVALRDPNENILTFEVTIEGGRNYTAYLIGSPWNLQAIVL